jgi:hypothetical protein
MAKTSSVLERLLAMPDIPNIVPRLPPEMLHRVIQTCGLEDCAEFVALATPAQLGRILDLDVWRSRRPGGEDQFDAERFGAWLCALMQSGPSIAAGKLRGLDQRLVVAGLARHIAVFDQAAIASCTTLDGEFVPGRAGAGSMVEIGGYAIRVKRTSAWDATLELLAFLDAEHPAEFHRLMRGCVELSDGRREHDGFHDLLEEEEQQLFDLGAEREARMEQLGYVTAAQASAFLREARGLRLDGDQPPPSVLAQAYFRASNPESALADTGERRQLEQLRRGTGGQPEVAAVAAMVEILHRAGALVEPRALLAGTERGWSRLEYVRGHVAGDLASTEELAYLANVLVAAGSIQGRPFAEREAGTQPVRSATSDSRTGRSAGPGAA